MDAEKNVEKSKIEDTEKMISLGMDNAEIRKITGLSVKKISEIRQKIQCK